MRQWKMLLPIFMIMLSVLLCQCNTIFFDHELSSAESTGGSATGQGSTTTPTIATSQTPTPELSSTPTRTQPPTATPTLTRTLTPTPTSSPTPSFTPTRTVTPTPTRTATPQPTVRANRPPTVTNFTATLVPEARSTFYQVTATDPDGDPLTYQWSNSNPCGTFTWNPASPIAQWFHPHPPCPDEPVHPGIISVMVSDGKGGEVKCEYSRGSASGSIAQCTR